MAITKQPPPLLSPVYSPFTYLTHCLHFSHLPPCYRQGALVSQPLDPGLAVLDQPHATVIWLQPSKSTLEHNSNGNVSFVIPINKIISRFGPHVYNLNQKVESTSHVSSRVLVSSSPISMTSGTDAASSLLHEISLNTKSGWPIKLCYGSWQHASRCRLQHSTTSLSHELNVGIVVNADDLAWLYAEAFVDVNDHSSANSRCTSWAQYNSRVCSQYNSQGKACPNEYTRFEAQQKLLEEFPLLKSDKIVHR